ncbi:uncharacterized protein LOC143860127 [Tasmannia lanceolata]|uniref:uncharacterized protein LOC143860127 n=1 Tax=Tasmannia lanceolata TaxID=3420 RepID=UPI0040649351
MANVTRSSKKLKDDDRNSSKMKNIVGKGKDAKVTSGSAKTETSGLRRSSRETPSKKQSSSSSPSSIRKSERLEKRPPSTHVKIKLVRVEKQRILGRSERGYKHRSSSSSGSKTSEKASCSLEAKRKTEQRENSGKHVVAVDMRDRSKSEKWGRKSVSLTLKKKKRLDARSYRAYLKPHPKKVKVSDLGEKHMIKDNISQPDSDNTDTSSSKQFKEGVDECSGKKGDELRGKHLGQPGEEAVEGSSSGSKKHPDRNLRNGIEEIELAHSSRKRKLCYEEEVHESKYGDCSPGSKYSDGSHHLSPDELIAKETIDLADRPEGDCLVREYIEETENNTDRAQVGCSTREGSISSEGRSLAVDFGKVGDFQRKRNAPGSDSDISVTGVGKGTHTLETSSPDEISSSPPHKRSKFIETCDSCSKPRLGSDTPNQICSCNAKTSNDLCKISLSEEVSKQAAILGTPQKDEIVSNCLHEDGAGENLDLDARKQSTGDEQLRMHGLTDSHTTVDIPNPLEEDRGRHGEECGIGAQPKDPSLENQMDTDQNACVKCKLGGKLLCCDGKGCRSSYHISCLDPPLKDVPPGIWYCLWCVKKKIESGVHSVSEGVEYIWDVKEAEVSDDKGVQTEKQYLVKYRGLAHVHNCWVPENQLLREAPMLVAKFNKRHQREKAITWKLEWTVPKRLLQRRLLISPEHCGDFLNCRYEWFVKWNGLGYEHATWELENASFLSSPEATKLISDYEGRRKKAKKRSDPSRADKVLKERQGPLPKLSKLPGGLPPGLDNDYLSTVNKLREYWHKSENALVVDDQERIVTVILFLLSLESHVCRPFLIISTVTALPVWEAEFMRLAPSIDVVVYNGNRDVRKSIRALEFYEEGGCEMFQVLLSAYDAIAEDFEALDLLGWEAVIVDECHRSRTPKHFEQIKTFTCGFRLLLVNGPIKDSIPEYVNLLSFLDSGSEGIGIHRFKNDSNDSIVTLALLKEKLARYLAYERKSDSSKFLEYWVPVQLSYVQLEQYCATLLSNSISLRSYSKNDPVGALRDILISTRKCCDHPYLVDGSLQGTLTKGLPEVEYLDVGVTASGKLQLLDKILPEIKNRGLRVLILFQSIGGSGRNSIGDILDDFLRQRFGADSYERVDSGLVASKKQAAMNMFNSRERGRFVFLIENRACLPSIKLLGVDFVIIFDSDWNPWNDLRALQKINIDSPFEQLKLFRLYSSCTVEEKVLIFAKQDMTLDTNIQNINPNTSHMLLIWGASYQFNKLDEFHGSSSLSIGSKISHEQSLLNEAVQELLMQVPCEADTNNTSSCSVISKVHSSRATYSGNVSLHGEIEMQSMDEDAPHVFWKKLLDGRFPRWRYLSGPSQRARKKVQYLGDSPKKPEEDDQVRKPKKPEEDQVRKKHKKGVSDTVDQTSLKAWLDDKRKAADRDREAKIRSNDPSYISPRKDPFFSGKVKEPGASGTLADNVSQHVPSSVAIIKDLSRGTHNPPTPHNASGLHAVPVDESEGRGNLRDAQKNLHLFLKPLLSTLCETLLLPEDVKRMAGKFLEYLMNNHRVSREPETILQALQISLCWVAASLLDHKVDRRESLKLAKKQLRFECKYEEAKSVYSMLRVLKRKFSCRTGTSKNATEPNSQEGQSSAPRNKDVGSEQQELEEGEIRETSQSCNSSQQRVFVEREPDHEEANATVNTQDTDVHLLPHLFDGNGSQNIEYISRCTRRVEKACARRTEKIILRQQEEVRAFHEYREKEIAKLKEAHRLESNLIKSRHRTLLDRLEKLKQLEENFGRKMKELESHMVNSQRKLVAMQLDARTEEKRLGVRWLEEAKNGRLVESIRKHPLPQSGFRMEWIKISEQSGVCDASENTRQMPEPSSRLPDVLEVAESTSPGVIQANVPDVVSNDVVVEDMPMRNPNMVGVGNENYRMDSVALEGTINSEVDRHICEENSHGADLISSTQPSQIDLASAQPPMSFEHNDSHSPHQVPSIECHPPLIYSEAAIEHMPNYEGQRFQQMEVLTPQPIDATSSQNELSNGNNNLVSERNSIQQTEVAAQLPVEALPSQDEQSNNSDIPSQVEQSNNLDIPSQVEQSNHSPSQPIMQPHMPPYTNMPVEVTPVADPGSRGILPESYNRPPQYPTTTRRTPLFHLDPFQNEMAKLHKEKDITSKMHEDEKIRLKSECEREIEEVRRKYNGLIQDREVMLVQRHKMIDTNLEKFQLNWMLAESFKYKFCNATPAARQGLPSTSAQCSQQPLQQALLQTVQRPARAISPVRAPVLAPALATAPTQPVQGVHHSSAPYPIMAPVLAPVPPTAPTQPVQVVHHSSALFSCSPTSHFNPIIPPHTNIQVGHPEPRAPAPAPHPTATPYFNPIIPSHINLHVSPEPRAPAPHLQSYRTMAPNHPPLPSVIPNQQSLPNLASMSSPFGAPSGTNLQGTRTALPFSLTYSPSALELLMGMDSHSGTNLRDQGLTIDTWVPSDLVPDTNNRGPSMAGIARVSAEVVCLSDDDN